MQPFIINIKTKINKKVLTTLILEIYKEITANFNNKIFCRNYAFITLPVVNNVYDR